MPHSVQALVAWANLAGTALIGRQHDSNIIEVATISAGVAGITNVSLCDPHARVTLVVSCVNKLRGIGSKGWYITFVGRPRPDDLKMGT
jgi:hypothetical protein